MSLSRIIHYRIWHVTACACALMCPTSGITAEARYLPTEQSISRHQTPTWWRDAKFGIFVHWGIYSVPGFAPREAKEYNAADKDANKALNPYAEWYYNTLLIAGSPTARFHANAYGKDLNYYNFARTFNEATRNWSPDSWAQIFQNVNARYVVLTTKHHDGFSLWPSEVRNPKLPDTLSHSTRDLVGELTNAVRQRRMRMGFYYSGLYDWSFKPGPIKDNESRRALSTQSPDYVAYADAQWRELIRRYRPDILWNDIGYSSGSQLPEIISDYLNAQPNGVINNRWSPYKIGDFTTPEYAKLDHISEQPWEMCRGIGKSFGLNRVEGPEETISSEALVHLLVDVVSKNGNLLLDVGPEPDGSIPQIQLDRLQALGGWLNDNGEAIFGTRPWTRFNGSTSDGIDVRFTSKGNAVYAILLGRPIGRAVTIKDVPKVRKAQLLGTNVPVPLTRAGADIIIALPEHLNGTYAYAFKLS